MRIPNRLLRFFLITAALLSTLGFGAGQSYFERRRAKKAIESTVGIPPATPVTHPVPIERDGDILILVGSPSHPR